jgi:hypothetical protein
LIRPARFRDSAFIGATPALSELTDARAAIALARQTLTSDAGNFIGC